jgi:hypothetical protein
MFVLMMSIMDMIMGFMMMAVSVFMATSSTVPLRARVVVVVLMLACLEKII